LRIAQASVSQEVVRSSRIVVEATMKGVFNNLTMNANGFDLSEDERVRQLGI
jgi:hypothetical protein